MLLLFFFFEFANLIQTNFSLFFSRSASACKKVSRDFCTLRLCKNNFSICEMSDSRRMRKSRVSEDIKIKQGPIEIDYDECCLVARFEREVVND